MDILDFNLARFLYERDSFSVFILVTLCMGGGAAFASGRAIALTWRPAWHIVFYMLILGAALRAIYAMLFDGTFISLHYYLVDTAICMIMGFLGYYRTRRKQMRTQYRWLFGPESRRDPITEGAQSR